MRQFLCRCCCLLMLFVLCAAVSELSAQELVFSKARITTGAKTLLTLPPGSGGYFCFELTNPGNTDRYTIVEIRSENALGKDQYFSKDFFAPANSVQQCLFPFQLDSSTSYNITYHNGRVMQQETVSILPWKKGARCNLTVSDQMLAGGEGTINGYSQLEGFPKPCIADSVTGENLPVTAHQLEHYRAILLYKTDFARWYAKSFDAVIEYVKNGGTLCFGTPQDAYYALQTPLADLVPLKFSDTRNWKTVSAGKLLDLEKQVAVSLVYLPAEPAEGARRMENSSRGFVEKKIGSGVVRASMFDLWQSAGELAPAGYGKVLGAFLDGTPIPERPIQYTQTTLEIEEPLAFGIPEGRRLILVIAVVFCGILLISVLEMIARLIFRDKVKKWHAYLAALIVSAVIFLLGCVNGGTLFDWVPLPGENVESQSK